jgi:hypothetical protein
VERKRRIEYDCLFEDAILRFIQIVQTFYGSEEYLGTFYDSLECSVDVRDYSMLSFDKCVLSNTSTLLDFVEYYDP